MAQILVVDDEVGIRELLSEILSDEGHTVQVAENATAARSLRARERPDLVLLDIWMPDADGITLPSSIEFPGLTSPAAPHDAWPFVKMMREWIGFALCLGGVGGHIALGVVMNGRASID